MHFPKPVRRRDGRYSSPSARFHLTLAAHPEIARLPEPVAEMIWAVVMEQHSAERADLLAACLMPDHLHLLLAPRRMDVLRFLNVLKSWTTTRSWELGHRGPLWQPGAYERTMRDEKDVLGTARYIVDNPRAAGLVEEAADFGHVWAYWFQ